MHELDQLLQPLKLDSLTLEGLRAALIEGARDFLYTQQPDDKRTILYAPEQFEEHGTYYVRSRFPTVKGVASEVKVGVYNKDDVEAEHFDRLLQPIEAIALAKQMQASQPNGPDVWAKDYILRVARFLEVRYGFHTTSILAPYPFHKNYKQITEVTEVLGVVSLPHLRESLWVGVERVRLVPVIKKLRYGPGKR